MTDRIEKILNERNVTEKKLDHSDDGSVNIRSLTFCSFGAVHLPPKGCIKYIRNTQKSLFHTDLKSLLLCRWSDVMSRPPTDASFSDEMSDLGSDPDGSRGPSEPAVKRERIELSHPLQEM